MKYLMMVWPLALACGSALANPYFAGNPYSPIPPGCLTLPDIQSELYDYGLPFQTALYGNNRVQFWEGQIDTGRNWWLTDTPPEQIETIPLDVRLYRVACSEPNRSAIIVEMQYKYAYLAWWPYRFPLLSFSAEQFWDGSQIVPPERRSSYSLLALPEPGPWRDTLEPGGEGQYMLGDYTGGWLPMDGYVWTYIIDAPAPGSRVFYADHQISAREYNEAFDLHIHVPSRVWQTIPVPATRDVLEQNQRLPLNGRLSGTWVAEGVTDQGFVLSFSNRVPASGQELENPERSPLNLFLTWYTFDTDGRMLWLTGVAQFPQGASQVDVPIVLVTGGEFLGGRQAQRAAAGQVTLTARGCDDLRLDYDLPGLDLGNGTHRLHRLHALEVAGYNCRDYESRRGLVELFPRD